MVSEGKPATLSTSCSGDDSKWDMISDSKLHLSSKTYMGSHVCLDVDGNNNIVTNACKCLSQDKSCDPANQWFKIIDSGKRSIQSSSTLSKTFMKPLIST